MAVESFRVSECEVIDLGVVEDYVYDVEVEQTHNFYGNGILIHNSVVFDASSIANRVDGDTSAKAMAVADFANGKILDHINEGLDVMARKLNCRQNSLSLKLESICDKSIFFAKKRYAINMVYDENGLRSTPDRKVTGVEIVRSETPKLSRKHLSKVIDIMFDGSQNDVYTYISKVEDEYMQAPPEEISVNKSCSNMRKWVDLSGRLKSGTPIQTKASIAYNKLLSEKCEEGSYDKIIEGDKMKYIYLKVPNPSGFEVIGFSTKLPTEFGLDNYLNRKLMYDKNFLSVVDRLVSFVGWNTVKKNEVDTDLFGF